jgi:hypothetical protein
MNVYTVESTEGVERVFRHKKDAHAFVRSLNASAHDVRGWSELTQFFKDGDEWYFIVKRMVHE